MSHSYVYLSVCRSPPSSPKEKRYRPEIWFTHSPGPYPFFSLFEKLTLGAASLEKTPHHLDYPPIFSITLYKFYLLYLDFIISVYFPRIFVLAMLFTHFVDYKLTIIIWIWEFFIVVIMKNITHKNILLLPIKNKTQEL